MKYVALWLSLICIVMFILQLIFPAITDNLVLNQQSFSQPYRFVTSIFLHGSPEHLIFNLFALIMFGLILESLIGSKKFLLVFFISGILANLITVNFYTSSLGASGAIYGIIGALAILRPLMPIWAFSLPLPMFVAAIIWVIVGIIGSTYIIPTNVAHIAHLSGIFFGAIFGLIIRLTNKQERIRKQKINIPEAYMQRWEDVHMKKRN